MIENMIEIVTHPVFWTVTTAVVARFAPQWMPFLGTGRKLVNELTDLHRESAVSNDSIVEQARKSGKGKALVHLNKQLMG